MRQIAGVRVRLLRRILRRFFSRVFSRFGEVGVGHLQVVFLGNRSAIANSLADNVNRVALGKLCLPGGAQVVE